ncbi:hypothetical protein AFE02nite_30060 [Actinotalea fermentans]|uniref:Uncharacterized protein n=1 Tax=Actinotalea fermentans TaxID=43671 RepID=A0A511Z1F4_9CELL|nr:hypothetical protein AFE02nite_30060 [Actinotalea fermentans]
MRTVGRPISLTSTSSPKRGGLCPRELVRRCVEGVQARGGLCPRELVRRCVEGVQARGGLCPRELVGAAVRVRGSRWVRRQRGRPRKRGVRAR